MFENVKKYHLPASAAPSNDNLLTASLLYSALVAMVLAIWKAFAFVNPTQLIIMFVFLFAAVFGVMCKMKFSINREIAMKLSVVVVVSIVCIAVF